MEVPRKNKNKYDLTLPLLGIYPKELKAGSGRDISIPMFTVLFTIAECGSDLS